MTVFKLSKGCGKLERRYTDLGLLKYSCGDHTILCTKCESKNEVIIQIKSCVKEFDKQITLSQPALGSVKSLFNKGEVLGTRNTLIWSRTKLYEIFEVEQ